MILKFSQDSRENLCAGFSINKVEYPLKTSENVCELLRTPTFYNITVLLKIFFQTFLYCLKYLMKTSHNASNTRFLYEKFSEENEPQKPQNLDKMFKKISSLKCRPAIFKITWFFPRALKKLQNWVNFSIFLVWNSFRSSLLITAPSSSIIMERLKDGHVDLCE